MWVQVVRRLLLERKLLDTNHEPIKSPTRCQRLATAENLKHEPWRRAAETGTAQL